MPKLSVELSETDHRRLKSKAALAGMTQSDVVRRFLWAWFEKQIDVPEEGTDAHPEQNLLAESPGDRHRR